MKLLLLLLILCSNLSAAVITKNVVITDKLSIDCIINNCELYEVQEGDTLKSISFQYYGISDNWYEIYNINKNTIGDSPDVIFPGMVLKVPKTR